MSTKSKKPEGVMRFLEILFILVLLFYPLRHVTWGVDLWDTGYNYANLTFSGLKYMDDMWFFATYLVNILGHLLTLLPFGHTLVGMNIYTGLVVSALGLVGYFFCTRELEIPSPVVFLGEYLALSLSWSPSAVLYHYMTYLFFFVGTVLLYKGLVREKRIYLILAGIALGLNIFVRFPNLTEAAMIVAVWAYAVVLALKRRREAGDAFDAKASGRKLWSDIFMHTLWCLAGYLAAVIVMLVLIQAKYGVKAYMDGVLRLFAMTDTATDYQSSSMIRGLIMPYVKLQFYTLRIAAFAAVGTVLFALRNPILEKLSEKKAAATLVKALSYIAFAALLAVLVLWLYRNHFFSFYYYSYDSMYWPGAFFLFLSLGISAWNILRPGADAKDKLIGGLVILLLMLSCLGSNNNIYPAINNLYLAAPVTLWQCVRFFTVQAKEGKLKVFLDGAALSVKGVLAVMLVLVLVQSAIFGASFVFAEATGISGEIDHKCYRVSALRGIKLSEQRAEAIGELRDYLIEEGLMKESAIFYGGVPSLSFYLQIPPAINVWPDLASYGYDVMVRDMKELEEEIDLRGRKKPIVIGSVKLLSESGADDPKWELICDFMAARGYALTYGNELFAVWVP